MSVPKSDFKQFQTVVQEKMELSHSLLDDLLSLPEDAKFGDYEAFRKKHISWIESQNISIFVFENKKTLYWSDNTIPPYFQLLSQDSPLFFSGNAWYLIDAQTKGDRDYFILFLLKKQYPFENEYIKNEFQRDFMIDDAVEIYNEPCDNAYDVYDGEGKFLLSLSTVKKSKPKTDENQNLPIALVVFVLSFAFFVLFLALYPNINYILKYGLLFAVVAGMLKLPGAFYILYWEGIVILTLAYVVFTFGNNFKGKKEILWYFMFGILSFVFCGTATGFIKSLALNSDIELELFNLLSTNVLSFVAYFEIGAFLFLYFAFCFRFSKKFDFEKKYSLPLLIGICLLIPMVTYLFLESPSEFFPYLVVFYCVTVVSTVIYSYLRRHATPTFALKLVFLIISVLYTETAISIYLGKNKAEKRTSLALEWANKQDYVAEQSLARVYKSTRSDVVLKKMMQNSESQDVDVKNYLQKMYFNGWLNQYDLECTICGSSKNFNETNQLPNCEAYFSQMVSASGKAISDTNYYFINSLDGTITYYDAIEYRLPDNSVTKLYIELHSKASTLTFGYPSFLLENSELNEFPERYSLAKYKNGVLISKRGRCPYPQKLVFQCDDEFQTFNDASHHVIHLAYKINDQYTVLVSNRTYQFKNYLMWFPYIFLYFFLLMLFFLRVGGLAPAFATRSLSVQIRRSLIGLLLGSFFFVAVCGALFIKSYNARQQRNFLEEKVSSAAKEFSTQYKDFAYIPVNDYQYIQNKLVALANVYSSDVNLYDTNGDLVASSRPEVFHFRLLNEKMATQAYYQLIEQNRSVYTQNETLGNLQFASSYVSIVNGQNAVLGYLNLPNFSNEEDFKQQFVGLIVSLLNIFVILLLLATILSMFIAKRISEPMVVLQNKMTSVAVGGENEKISLDAPDELAGVIQNYNEMIDKLGVSAEKLAKVEREMAWREMARQIAHEIKNPLTPMKLSLQLLNRSWDEKDEKFESRLKSISKTIIEQIDTLADTATSFSDFAKLSEVKFERVNLNELLQNCILLFEQEGACSIEPEFVEEQVIARADKEKTMRLFNNLLKNAIQSVPSGKTPQIKVILRMESGSALVSIKDNGRGIDDEVKKHIFDLHFTTKSTGSGLGLAICKNIVEGCGGDIWFETTLGEGTTFFVKLPLDTM